MRNRKLTNLFMSSMPASFWEKMGRKNVLTTLKVATEKIDAYRDFLKNHGINPDDTSIHQFENFKKLPVMDKKNYILNYTIKELCSNIDDIYTIERSSGYSNISVFWPRLPEEDALFPSYIEYAFVQFYHINIQRTLVITTLALGTWVSGEKMAQALRTIAVKKKYKLAVMSPGANLEDTLEIVENLSSQFEQTIIVGYPPFIKTVIEDGEKRGINWKKVNVKIGVGGEGYSEKWRELIAEKIGLDKKDLLGISGGYGAADLGMTIGREYPISVLIRKLAENDNKLAEELFGFQSVPSLLQYNPAACYIESFNNELLFTIRAGIPAIRYNIHDRGGVISYERMIAVLNKFHYDILAKLENYGYTAKDIWRLPFFYIFGRSDGSVSISGMNVYPENIEAALHTLDTNRINSFKISKQFDAEHNEKLCILVELKRDVKLSGDEFEKFKVECQSLFLEKLLAVNKDFRYVYNARPHQMKPIVKIFNYREGLFREDYCKIKKSYIVK